MFITFSSLLAVESPPPGYLSDDTSGVENSPGACSSVMGGSSGMYCSVVMCLCVLCVFCNVVCACVVF